MSEHAEETAPTPECPMPDEGARLAVLTQQAAKLFNDGRIDDAADLCREVLLASPSDPDAMHLLGMSHHAHGDNRMAITLLKAASMMAPYEQYLYNLGVVNTSAGEIEAAIAALRHALSLDPDYIGAATNLIFALDLFGGMTPELRLAERRAYNDRFCAALTKAAPPHANTPDPNRRLNVGYVGGDYRVHSASMSYNQILQNHDPRHVKLFIYSTLPVSKQDAFTKEFQAAADVWFDADGLGDMELADQIREDGIDVLVDLSAYSAYGRLPVFARRPAPVQISAWGYCTGTGIDAMDYLVSDAVAIPKSLERYYSEKILRMPCLLMFDMGEHPPEVGPLPCETNGYITFGFLGRPVKLSMQQVAIWGQIMRQVPNSHLLLKGDEYRDPILRERISDTLIAMGVSLERLQIMAGTPLQEHRSTYRLVDIALDPSPNGGGITTFEATMMGVPSVTMLGQTVPSRITASILTMVGLTDHPTTIEGYVEQAVALAGDREQLAMLRTTLRTRLRRSIVTDSVGYTRLWERRLREVWRQWCSEQRRRASAA